jgi:hypothetical protein
MFPKRKSNSKRVWSLIYLASREENSGGVVSWITNTLPFICLQWKGCLWLPALLPHWLPLLHSTWLRQGCHSWYSSSLASEETHDPDAISVIIPLHIVAHVKWRRHGSLHSCRTCVFALNFVYGPWKMASFLFLSKSHNQVDMKQKH